MKKLNMLMILTVMVLGLVGCKPVVEVENDVVHDYSIFAKEVRYNPKQIRADGYFYYLLVDSLDGIKAPLKVGYNNVAPAFEIRYMDNNIEYTMFPESWYTHVLAGFRQGVKWCMDNGKYELRNENNYYYILLTSSEWKSEEHNERR
jgi:hypothetical protein